MLFVTDFLKNNKIIFNSNTISQHRNFAGFQYYAIASLNNSAFKLLKRVNKHSLHTFKFKSSQKKLYNSQIRF